MAATPQRGTMVFEGLSKRKYIKEVYVSDVAGALITWDSGAGAGTGSSTEWIPPELVSLRDFSMITGTADTTKLQVTIGGVPSGDILRYANHLSSLNSRPELDTLIPAGVKVQAIQLA